MRKAAVRVCEEADDCRFLKHSVEDSKTKNSKKHIEIISDLKYTSNEFFLKYERRRGCKIEGSWLFPQSEMLIRDIGRLNDANIDQTAFSSLKDINLEYVWMHCTKGNIFFCDCYFKVMLKWNKLTHLLRGFIEFQPKVHISSTLKYLYRNSQTALILTVSILAFDAMPTISLHHGPSTPALLILHSIISPTVVAPFPGAVRAIGKWCKTVSATTI